MLALLRRLRQSGKKLATQMCGAVCCAEIEKFALFRLMIELACILLKLAGQNRRWDQSFSLKLIQNSSNFRTELRETR